MRWGGPSRPSGATSPPACSTTCSKRLCAFQVRLLVSRWPRSCTTSIPEPPPGRDPAPYQSRTAWVDSRGIAGLVAREMTMLTAQPIHTLRDNLEGARLELIQKIASEGALPADALRELSIIQGALTAVRDEIASREPRVG